MFSFKSVYFVIFILVLLCTRAEISDKRLCVDENCSELIAVGVTLLRYNSLEKNILSFGPKEHVKIFSYGAGKRPDLVGVELRGVRGYVNKNHIRETNLLKRPSQLVDTELAEDKPEVPLQSVANEINANPTYEPYEIVDGTKIPLDVAASTTYQTPIVEILKGQDKNLENTKNLDSVPEFQKSNQLLESPVASTESKKVDSKPQVEHADKDDEDGDDDDDEGDDGLKQDDDDDEEENDENANDDTDQEKMENTKNVLPKKEAKPENPSNISLSSGVEGTVNNIGINNTSSSELSQKDAKLDTGKENVISNETIQSNQNNESTGVASNIIETIKITELGSEVASSPDAKAEDNKSNAIPEVSQSMQSKETIEVASDIIETVKSTELGKEVANSPELIEKDANGKNNVISEEAIQSNQNNESVKILSNIKETIKNTEPAKEAEEKTTNTKSDTQENLTQGSNISEPIPVESSQIIANPNVASLPTPSEESNITSFDEKTTDTNGQADNVLVDLQNTTDTKGQADNVLVDLQNFTGEVTENNANEANKKLSENNESIATEVYPGIAPPTTEIPIAMEVYPPIDIDEVTTNPIEEQKPENTPPPTQTSYEESAEAKLDNVPSVEESIEQINTLNEDTGEIVDRPEDSKDSDNQLEEASNDIFSGVLSFFGLGGHSKENEEISDDKTLNIPETNEERDVNEDRKSWSAVISSEPATCDSTIHKCPLIAKQGFCDKESKDCPTGQHESIFHQESSKNLNFEDLQELFIETFSSDMFLYLLTTSFSVIIMVFMWIILDKCRREGPLIARINKLEQQLLATKKENDTLHEKASLFVEEKSQLVVETVPNEIVDELNSKLAEMAQEKMALEEQIQALEKELDTSTEVGIELNKIISEMLNSTDASEILKENVEQMQKRVLEQQATINNLNETLSLKETEIHELRLELEICNKKITDLQGEVDKMVEKILKIEEERDQLHNTLESEMAVYQNKCKEALTQEHVLKAEILALKQKNAEIQRVADIKVKEYNTLKETLNSLKTINNDKEAIKSFLDVSEIKAQLEQIKSENLKYSEQLSQEREINLSYTSQIQNLSQEVSEFREKYEKADKAKVEINTKLEVLNNYFKEKEEQMQKEIAKYETLWAAKAGETTSTTERIRYMQEELQNYKAQNESLKQEIVNQEVELKSQISMLEKKVHENWVTNRQAERKLEDARQEAALLRNRLTLRERAIAEGNNHIRMQSPLHQNGELPISPPPIDPTQSPPPLYNPRDHITKSPPIPGMPPFLPPPLGPAPFIPPPPLEGMIPPPLGDISGMHPPFIPGLHPGMFPGDHRPPPLGRMSSPPPVGGRYSPESTIYSEYDRYDRRSPSPPYDSEYGASPPPIMGYSPYDSRDRDRYRDDRREYKRPQPRSNGRNSKGFHSSGSENDSLGKVNKKPQRKV